MHTNHDEHADYITRHTNNITSKCELKGRNMEIAEKAKETGSGMF